MKIKEAAALCGLTEKAIRLYEAKGLIHPASEERGGRIFRDYDDACIRELMTVGILRHANFSMEQIGEMQTSPERIPEIFAAYREEIRANAAQLSALAARIEAIDADALADVDALAAGISGETALPDPEKELPRPTVWQTQHRAWVWDEDFTLGEKEAAYERFLRKYERREKVKDILLAAPREIAAVWACVPRTVRRAVLIASAAWCALVIVLTNMVEITPYTHVFEGVEYRRGDGTVTPITVTFDGELHRYLFKKDYFAGDIRIDGYTPVHWMERTIPMHEADLELFRSSMRLYYEDYPAVLTSKRTPEFYGGDNWDKKIFFGAYNLYLEHFETPADATLVMSVFDLTERTANSSHWSFRGDTGAYIVAPAKTRDDAEYCVRCHLDKLEEIYPPPKPQGETE